MVGIAAFKRVLSAGGKETLGGLSIAGVVNCKAISLDLKA